MGNDQRGTDVLDKFHEYGVDLKRRRVFMQCPFYPHWDTDAERAGVGGWSDMVIRNLLWLDANGDEPIELWLSTPGGSTDEMWAIYDAMRTARSLIHTVALGNVSSAGCLILAGGTGTRYAMPNASFMWHGGWQGVDGELRTVQQRVDWYNREMARWIETFARLTKVPGCRGHRARVAYWESHTHDSELWLDPKGMKRHGIIDEIWGW